MSNLSLAVDLSSLEEAIIAAATPNWTVLHDAILAATQYVRDTWAQAVQGRVLPGMTGPVNNDDYMESLFTGQSMQLVGPLEGAVISTYHGIDRIERGYAAYDMKPALLNGPSARTSKDGGKYNVIPFRHMTPDQRGMGGSGKGRAHGATMPQGVYDIVKASGVFIDPGNAALGEQWGQRSKPAMAQFKMAQKIDIRAIALKVPPKGGYTWKNGLYHNMRKVVKSYSQTDQSTYFTFRAVSSKSDPQSWLHPGVGANPVMQAVVNATRADVEKIIMAGAKAAFGVS